MPGLVDRLGGWMVALALAAPACSWDTVPGTPSDAMKDTVVDTPPDTTTADWWDPMWTRRRRVTIRNTELTGPVAGFPLLVQVPREVVDTASVGDDIRFVLGRNMLLPFELDTVVATVGALAWVRMPALTNTGPAPELWLYYGNATAMPAGNGMTTFGDMFVSVHHLGQNVGLSLGDATGHGHTATPPGPMEMPSSTPGRIGGARDFDGNNDHLTLAGEPSYDFTTQLSVSAWVRVQSFDLEWQAIVTKGDSSWRMSRNNQTNFAAFGTDIGAASLNTVGDVNINDAQWHHVAIVFNNSTRQLFVDGQLDQADATGAAVDTNNRPVAIGRNDESVMGGQRFWDGDIDEVRISQLPRDAPWMFAEHHTVTDADFVQVGAEEMYRP